MDEKAKAKAKAWADEVQAVALVIQSWGLSVEEAAQLAPSVLLLAVQRADVVEKAAGFLLLDLQIRKDRGLA